MSRRTRTVEHEERIKRALLKGWDTAKGYSTLREQGASLVLCCHFINSQDLLELGLASVPKDQLDRYRCTRLFEFAKFALVRAEDWRTPRNKILSFIFVCLWGKFKGMPRIGTEKKAKGT